jgi:two-component system, OmpR family, response regulator RegX3
VHIAILEDDADVGVVMKRWLEEAGYRCQIFNSGKKLASRAARESFDLYLIDWSIPDMSGLEVLKWIRHEHRSNVPVLFVTVRNAEKDVIAALESGADDFMSKPVRRGELVARTQALLRRAKRLSPEPDQQSFPPYRVVSSARQIFKEDAAIDLTEKEFDLAVFLFNNTGKLLSRQYISETVWGKAVSTLSRTIDTHVSRVRKKLDIAPQNGFRLVPVYNIGYRLERVNYNVANAANVANEAILVSQ